MIKPHKYLNLEISVLAITAYLLQLMQSEQVLKHDDLIKRLISTFGQDAKVNVGNAINFAYLLGKINYYQDIDSFEFSK